MRKLIYGLFGQRAGSVIVGSWNWLWGIPVEQGGASAVAVAEESLKAMQASVAQLTQAVSVQVGSYRRAEQKYLAKVKEFQSLEAQAKMASQQGNKDAARLAMGQALQIEKILPQLKANVEQAEAFVTAAKQKLNIEKQRLADYRSELSNMRDINEVNQALEEMTRVNNSYDIGSAKSQFERAKNAVERRQFKVEALNELSQDPTEKLTADLSRMTLDDEVSRRLAQLEGGAEPLELPALDQVPEPSELEDL